MPLMIFNLPITNTIGHPIALYNVATVGPGLRALAVGEVAILSVTFDRIRISTPTLPRWVYVQSPNVPVEVHPGWVGYFRDSPVMVAGHPTYVLSLGQAGQPATTNYVYTR